MVQPPRNAALREHLLASARALRQTSTNAELLLWSFLRNRRFLKLKFRRQHPIGNRVLDFYCEELHWGIELDGGQHNSTDGKQGDAERTAELARHGIMITRFWNHDVLSDLETVLESLFQTVVRLRSLR